MPTPDGGRGHDGRGHREDERWKAQLESLGGFIRSQRQLARLSLRQLAELTEISNPYLSQVERGLHQPSVRVIRSIARALNLSAETLLAQGGLLEDDGPSSAHSATGAPPTSAGGATEAAIKVDPLLTDAQKEALLSVYRSFVAEAKE